MLTNVGHCEAAFPIYLEDESIVLRNKRGKEISEKYQVVLCERSRNI